jgi:vancomycin resistance protein VanJ
MKKLAPDTRLRRRPGWFVAAALVNAALLLIIWGIQLVAPGHWLGLLLTCAPQPVFLLVSIVLLFVSLVRRRRAAILINAVALVFVATVLMDLHIPHAAPPSSGVPMRVMTYNVEKWSHGAESVAAVVRQFHPDVVCFQEAGDYDYVPGHQPDVLRMALENYHFYAQGEIMLAARHPLRDIRSFALPPGPLSRPGIRATLDVEGRPVAVITTHLLPGELGWHLRDLPKLPDYCTRFVAHRRQQDQELLAAASAVKTPLVICGDFNAQRRTEACRLLTHVYPDAFDAVGAGYGYTIVADQPTMRVDHVLTSPGISPKRVWAPNVRASDHRPIVADLILAR